MPIGKAPIFTSAFSPGPHRMGAFQRIRRSILLCEESSISEGIHSRQANDISTSKHFAFSWETWNKAAQEYYCGE